MDRSARTDVGPHERPELRTRLLGPLRFGAVGLAGLGVNLIIYSALVGLAGAPAPVAAVIAFPVAVLHNYLLNRAWTFRDRRGDLVGQGVRFATVSLGALAVDLLALSALLGLGAEPVPAQAAAVALAGPVAYAANLMWSFGAGRIEHAAA